MYYISTRNKGARVTGPQAVVAGLAPDGGLYVPETFPEVGEADMRAMADMSYPERAAFIVGLYLPELKDVLLPSAEKAYGRFEDDPAPVVQVDEDTYFLELWHGPTHAFKDMALTLLPYLLTESKRYLGDKEGTLILVATSGDTGKAALEGFRDVPGTEVTVFYPSDGVSAMQKLQMMTQTGGNVRVAAIRGNFDDAQTAVKNAFASPELSAALKKRGLAFSSANSINWGRLVPQIAYYFSAYLDIVNAGKMKMGDKLNFAVPTGNFGNILAAYYASRMGLPVGRLICASNRNNVLTDFFRGGEYDSRREFYKTMSPSMDILVSSNLERLLFEISGRDDALTAQRMRALKETGTYTVTARERAALSELFWAGYADEETSAEALGNLFEEYGYIADPHTSVAAAVFDGYVSETGDDTPTVIVSTASPYKFARDVLKCLGETVPDDDFKALKKLEDVTALPVPDSLSSLQTAPRRFTAVIDKTEIFDFILSEEKQ